MDKLTCPHCSADLNKSATFEDCVFQAVQCVEAEGRTHQAWRIFCECGAVLAYLVGCGFDHPITDW